MRDGMATYDNEEMKIKATYKDISNIAYKVPYSNRLVSGMFFIIRGNKKELDDVWNSLKKYEVKKEVIVKDYTYNELREIAKKNGINAHRMKKIDLFMLLKSKNLI